MTNKQKKTKEKQEILTLDTLESESICQFCLINYFQSLYLLLMNQLFQHNPNKEKERYVS